MLEASMNTKKLVLAIIVAYVVLMGSNFLIHSVWLMKDYQAIPTAWRPMDQMQQKIWIMWIGQLFFAILFAYIYTRGLEAKPWVAQGIRYGILMTFFTVIPYSLGEYVVYRVPHMLAVKWMIAGGIQLIVLGLIVAGIYKSPRAA
jgi:hypothetical protein